MNAAAERPMTPEERRKTIRLHRDLDEAERRDSRGELEAFLYRYLPAEFSHAPGDFHRAIYRDLESIVFQRLPDGFDPGLDADELAEIEAAGAPVLCDAAAFAYPRGHGKTTTITLGFLAWVLSEWRNMPHFRGEPPFILIVSDTLEQARDRSLDLRDHIEGNELLRDEYGDQVPTAKRKRGGTKWTETDWTTADGCRIKAVGSGTKVRGMLRKGRRPTLIVCDDLENDEAVATQARRRKLERWLQKALIPCGIEGRVATIAVGTILHADSLLSRLLSTEHYSGWLKRRFAALYNDEGVPDAHGTIPLWPEGWPLFRLRARKRKIGSIAFTQEYLNQAIDEATALFRRNWLNAARNRGLGRSFVYAAVRRIAFDLVVSTWDYAELVAKSEAGAYQVVVTAWDLALVDDEKQAADRDSDWTVGTTVGLDASDRLHVCRIFRKRGMTPQELRERIVGEQSVVGADYVAVENNQAQKLIEIDLRQIPNLPIVGHTTDRKKHSVYEGVPGMSLLFENGRIDLHANNEIERKRVSMLIDELHGLGLEAHDDMVMSLWIAICVIRRWQRKRDARRRKLIGKPPPGYVDVFPTRHQEAA